jgi:hypothetical protein
MNEIVRSLTTHHDGHGLNESISIGTDAPDGSGAAHFYILSIDGETIATIQFQKGPRNVEGSLPGATEAALYAILIDRLDGFQRGPYPSKEGAMQLTKLQECKMWARERADERAKRGVLGTNNK